MIAMVDEQRLQHLAAECLHISERTGDERTASELVKLSHQVLELATPSLKRKSRKPIPIRGAGAYSDGSRFTSTPPATAALTNFCPGNPFHLPVAPHHYCERSGKGPSTQPFPGPELGYSPSFKKLFALSLIAFVAILGSVHPITSSFLSSSSSVAMKNFSSSCWIDR